MVEGGVEYVEDKVEYYRDEQVGEPNLPVEVLENHQAYWVRRFGLPITNNEVIGFLLFF